MSLRQSRTVYRTLAVIFLPFAFAGLFRLLSAGGFLLDSVANGYFPYGLGSALLDLLIGAVFLGAEWAVVAQSMEAGRRIEKLESHPDANVRALPAPFKTWFFGPYH